MPNIKSLLSNKNMLRKALKLTGVGAAAGGIGYTGHKLGYRSGANEMGDAMATAFSQQNAVENAGIMRNFQAANKIENNQIARNAFKQGIMYGMQSQPAKTVKAGGVMAKVSSMNEIGKEAFLDELEKISAKSKTLKKLISRVAGTLKRAQKKLPKKYRKYAPAGSAAAAGIGVGGGAGYIAGTDERTVTVKHKRS